MPTSVVTDFLFSRRSRGRNVAMSGWGDGKGARMSGYELNFSEVAEELAERRSLPVLGQFDAFEQGAGGAV